MSEFAKSIVKSKLFSRTILGLIVLTGLLVGLETYPDFQHHTPAGKVVNFVQHAILWVFVVEVVLRMASFGSRPWEYFKSPWNLFDFIIIVVSMLPLIGVLQADTTFVSVFRLARLLRTLRMLTLLPRLQLLVAALLRSIPSLGYVGILLGLHFYIYAVMATFIFGANDPIRFGTLHQSALTLFQVLTLEGWNDIRDTQFMGSDATYDQAQIDRTVGVRHSEAMPLATSLFFISFILLGTMIMLNLFTGVVITSMEEAQIETDQVPDRDDALKERGYLTLQEELTLVGRQLAELNEKLDRLQLDRASPTVRAIDAAASQS